MPYPRRQTRMRRYHARSSRTRKQMRGGGHAASKAAPAPAPAPASKAASKNQEYHLPFTAYLMPTEKEKLSDYDKEDAQRLIEHDADWKEYLKSAMRDTLDKEVPVKNVLVVIKSEKDNGADETTFTGVVAWKSVACDLGELQDQLNWYIGDRMSQYEMENEDWHVFIKPGKVALA